MKLCRYNLRTLRNSCSTDIRWFVLSLPVPVFTGFSLFSLTRTLSTLFAAIMSHGIIFQRCIIGFFACGFVSGSCWTLCLFWAANQWAQWMVAGKLLVVGITLTGYELKCFVISVLFNIWFVNLWKVFEPPSRPYAVMVRKVRWFVFRVEIVVDVVLISRRRFSIKFW